jgi:hypothetical protein
MTACTEQHPGPLSNGITREGQKSMPRRLRMTACTEQHPGPLSNGIAREGQKDMPKEAQHD